MTERLTKRSTDTTHENGVCCTHFNGKECQEFAGNCAHGCKWEEAVWSKLAHYEDLQEQGRLVVLPEELDKETFAKHLALTACPAFVGLKDWQGTENCKDTTECCKECWEKALKGE